ncbi:hypothetical protein CVT25_015268 [Psilocybe cyanescens]|uniref:Major facilitator superfamily (MFS) profile domain-containing protein n=1 Tax=Psilocybe cyanescens TaxID=93625 RepID=A0A409XRC3_PSICY|nr:hypothetical protein CVT25_015268 [Psilocybe cyanescens]
MDSASYNSEKQGAHHTSVSIRDVDVAASLDSDAPLDSQVAARIRRKIDWHLMPFIMTFADKTTLGQSAVLGIIPDAHLTQNQFNWLGTIFYLSYLVFQYPQNLALQKFPVAKWMSINIFVWAIALLAHSACKSFGALFAVRFILGMCAITPGFMIVTSMFYTRAEQNKRVGYWFLMNGFAIIILGFISFGVLHAKVNDHHRRYYFDHFRVILVHITSHTLSWSSVPNRGMPFQRFYFPDSPTTAYFLTPEERTQAVQRIKGNQAGIENKQWKRDQFIETCLDPKIWVMAAFAATANIVNSLTNQRQLIINQFGFSPIKTTLLGCVDGVVEIVTIWLGVTLASRRSIGRGYAAALMFIPALLGTILVNKLPSHDKVGLLFSYWSSCLLPSQSFLDGSIPLFPDTPNVFFGLALSGNGIDGNNIGTTTNAIILSAYAIANAAGPFMWKKKYTPRYVVTHRFVPILTFRERNHVPWTIISACIGASFVLILTLRFMLHSENKRREAEKRDDSYDDVYFTEQLTDGTKKERKVDRAFLDLTDLQNRDFRYDL